MYRKFIAKICLISILVPMLSPVVSVYAADKVTETDEYIKTELEYETTYDLKKAQSVELGFYKPTDTNPANYTLVSSSTTKNSNTTSNGDQSTSNSGSGGGGGGNTTTVTNSYTTTTNNTTTNNMYVQENDYTIVINFPTPAPIEAKIGELYSVNNTSDKDYYYNPTLDEVKFIENAILQYYDLTSLYVGNFDVSKDSGDTLFTEHKGEYKYDPNNSANSRTCRELEILGYDFLLDNFVYDFSSGNWQNIMKGTSTSSIDTGVAIMNIYKALGKPRYDVKVVAHAVNTSVMQTSPAILNLPNFITGVNGEHGRIEVAVSRTSLSQYQLPAMIDLGVSANEFTTAWGNHTKITAADFIVYVADLMDLYGEPVLTEMEVNLLLQYFGGDIPEYLNNRQKEAYIYLKARGCINDDEINWNELLTYDDMLDILMRVKDKDSRATFKEIQLTYNLSEDLIAKGYFPKTVNLALDSDGLYFGDPIYEFGALTPYDYFIEIDEHTEFVDKDSKVPSRSICCPAVTQGITGENVSGFKYLGREVIGGKEYYHLQIASSARGISDSGKYFQLNTRDDSSDVPYYYWFEAGGGIYSYSNLSDKGNSNGDWKMLRTPFPNTTVWNAYRCAPTTKTVASSFLSRLFGLDTVETVFCADDSTTVTNWVKLDKYSYDRTREVFFNYGTGKNRYNVDILAVYAGPDKALTKDEYKIAEMGNVPVTIESTNVVVVFKGSNSDVTNFVNMLSRNIAITRGEAKADSPDSGSMEEDPSEPFQEVTVDKEVSYASGVLNFSISSVKGDIMLSYLELVEHGIVNKQYTENALPLEDPATNAITLTTKYGVIRLNNYTHEIIVGNTIYRVPGDTLLYQVTTRDGIPDMLIDFRAFYGWSANEMQMTVSTCGSSDGYTLSVEYYGEQEQDLGKLADVQIVYPWDTVVDDAVGRVTTRARCIKAGAVFWDDGTTNKNPVLISTADYSMANWVIYHDYTTDGARDYCIIYYPKTVADKLGIDADANREKLKSITGYAVNNEEWAYQVLTLKHTAEVVPGQFSYVQGFGYVYNIPTIAKNKSKQTTVTEEYLSGNWLLPIFIQDKVVYNFNANVYKAENSVDAKEDKGIWEYGYYPQVGTNGFRVLDLDGKQRTKYSDTKYKLNIVEAAPVGVVSFFGRNKLMGWSNKHLDMITNALTMNGNKDTVFYIGTLRISTMKQENSSAYLSTYGGIRIPFSDDIIFYPMYTYYNITHDGARQTQSIEAYAIRVAFMGTLQVDAVEGYKPPVVEFETEDTTDDSFSDYAALKLEDLLTFIDNGTSIVIAITMYIIPMIIFGMLTVLVGFSLLSDTTFVRNFCEHVIDPVYIVTFGHLHVGELNLRKSFWGLLAGYLGCILVYDGNLLRILMWAMEFVDALSKAARIS